MGAVLAEQALVRICDLAGRPRGTGFVADGTGTVITSHEAVDGLARVVVHAHGERSRTAEADAVTPLPEWDLALIRTEGLGIAPLLVGAERPTGGRTPVRLYAGEGASGGGEAPWRPEGGWTGAELAGTPTTVTYTSTDRFHDLEGALELTLPASSAARLRLNGRASGSPVIDAATGAVLAVLGTALHAPGAGPRSGFAVPLRTAALWEPEGQLSALLARNGATVPGFGPDLNPAGALRLTAATVRPAVTRAAGGVSARPVERPEVARALGEFCESGASVAALVGRPGTGRTTELAAFAARRSGGGAPAPTVWLRGAELREGDGGVREALGRALDSAARELGPGNGHGPGSGHAPGIGHVPGVGHVPGIRYVPVPVAVDRPGYGQLPGSAGGPVGGEASAASRADVVARLAREARRPLLVLLDAPEEMPARLAGDLRRWTAGTASWLRASGARMVIACGPEQWAALGELFPAELLYGESVGDAPSAAAPGPRALPPCVRLGGLPAPQAARARALYGLGADEIAAADAGHPLALRMLAEIRASQGEPQSQSEAGAPAAPPGRDDIFSAYLALAALRIAGRLSRTAPDGDCAARQSGGAVRRLAARTAGALHEAARRCLAPAQGALGRGDFEEVFPRPDGWADAVLADGVLEAAGDGYRFADEEFGDWLQGRHLDVDAALEALVHRRRGGGEGATTPAPIPVPAPVTAPVHAGIPAPGRAPAQAPAPLPRHRIGPIVHALVLSARLEGASALERRLRPLAEVIASGGEPEAVWWAHRLLHETLLRVPDARPYYGLLRGMAEHFAGEGQRCAGAFGPSFWRGLALPTAQRMGLLRLLLPVDAPPSSGGDGKREEERERFLDVVAEALEAEPATVQPLLCGWFTDRRPLAVPVPPSAPDVRTEAPVSGRPAAGNDSIPGPGPGGVPRPTVASAAQALLYAHRRQALDMTLDLLTDACHPRADELLGELAQEEPSALCRAVERWAHDERTLRQIAAAEYGPRMVGATRTDEDRRHLERGAQALLRIQGGSSPHGAAALAMLLRLRHGGSPEAADEVASAERDRQLLVALGLLAATGSVELSRALTEEVGVRPGPALEAFRTQLCERPGSGARHLTEALAAVRRPDLAVPTADVVREYAEMRPETAADALAGFVRNRLAHRPDGCAGLQLLTDALVCTPYAPLRESLARALGALGGPVPEALLGVLLVGERDPGVLEAALENAAYGGPAALGAQEAPGPREARVGQGAAGASAGPRQATAQARVPCVSH